MNEQAPPRSFTKDGSDFVMISAAQLRRMSMKQLVRFGESVGLSMDGVDSIGGAITRLCRSAVEFRNIS